MYQRTLQKRGRFPQNGQFLGFTLVEILVAMAILVMLVGVSVAGMVGYANHQRYNSVVDGILHELSLARMKTMASYENTVYGVYVGTSTIEFFEGATPVVGSSDNTIVTLADRGITATSTFANGLWYLTFVPRTGEASTEGSIVIERTDGSASTTFVIYESGLVE